LKFRVLTCALFVCIFGKLALCQEPAPANPTPDPVAVNAAPQSAASDPATTPDPAASPNPAPLAPGTTAPPAGDNAADDHRIFKVFPNYKTINDPDQPFEPLTAGQKFALVNHYFDPFTFVFTSITASIEQATNEKAAYGQGVMGYAKRYGADFTDGFTNELFVTGVFPTLLHEDPRYYRLGHGSGLKRTAYALSRILVTRTDSGGSRFNSSEFLGNFVSGALSITYYPQSERNIGGIFTRMGVEIGYDSLFNLLKEFYPDIKRRMRKHEQQ
jgi:hypothetical protein